MKKSKCKFSFRLLFGITLFVAGLITTLYPFIMRQITAVQMDGEISSYEQNVDNIEKKNNSKKSKLDELYDKFSDYNSNLMVNGQSISSSDDFVAFDVDITKYGFKDNVIGVIEIPKIEQRLPLYLGASEKNMLDGATVLGQTSAPIGGLSTNCVIAGHRGSITATKFRKIDELEIGDKVYIENPWGKLTYKVVSTKAVKPSDVSNIRIQPGKDMISLFSCHPYPQNYQRYFVFCERVITED